MQSQSRSRKAIAVVTKSGQTVGMAGLKAYETRPESKQLSPDAFERYYAPMGLIAPLYDLDRLARLLEINTIHARCVRTKAQDTAGRGWEIVPSESLHNDPSEEQYDRLFTVLTNQWPPLSVALVRFMMDYETLGNGYLECIREGYDPERPIVAFAHVPGHTMRIHRSKLKFCQSRDNKRVWFRALGTDGEIDARSGEEKSDLPTERRATDILHCYQYTPRSTYYGLPDALPALGAMVGSASAQDYNISFFGNFGVPAYLVSISGDYDPERDEDGNDLLLETIAGYFKDLQGEPHSTLALSVPSTGAGQVKVDVQALAVDVKDSSFRMYRKDNRDEVLSAHGVPGYRAGLTETGSLGGSTAEESTKIYLESVIGPRQEMIESYFNEFILPTLEVADWRFKLRPPDTRREEYELAVASGMFSQGAMTPNDLIRMFGSRFGLEPVDHPAMDAHYINGVPLDYVPKGEAQENEAIMAVRSLHERLVEIVRKDAGSN